MDARFHDWVKRSGLGHFILVTTWCASLAFLLTLPMARHHRFGLDCSGADETGSPAELQIELAVGDMQTLDPRPRNEIVSALTIAPVPSAATARAGAPAATTEIPLARLLSRLKLGSHTDSDRDSLS
jgi:hypothetical protein